MQTVSRTTPGGTIVTYPWQTGSIDWDGRTVQAFVFKGVALEGGLHARHVSAILVNFVLSDNVDLSSGLWAAFVKSPQGMQIAEWELVGAGIGPHHPLSPEEALPEIISEAVIRQLESIFP